MKKFNTQEAYNIYKENEDITKACKQHCEELGIEYHSKYYNRLHHVITYKKELVKAKKSKTKKAKKKRSRKTEVDTVGLMPSALNPKTGKFYSVEEYCEIYNLPFEDVVYSKLCAHNKGHMAYNISFKENRVYSSNIDESFVKDAVTKALKTSPVVIETSETNGDEDYWDRLVYTDVHIGMDTNGSINVKALYDGDWSRERILERLEEMIVFTLKNKKGDFLAIDEMGDMLDGLDGKTTRKGHPLPQLMSDKESFDLAVEFKIKLLKSLAPHYKKIKCHSVCSDNHSGKFAYFVNSAIKQIVNVSFDNVEYVVLERFMEHYKMFKHTKVISHGKDEESMKFGFKIQLDPKQAEKIDQYCKTHKLYDGNYVEFGKGDSHQMLFDYTTSNDFTYMNYPAFSPPSNWVKLNFKNTKSGFVFFNIAKETQHHMTHPYFFE